MLHFKYLTVEEKKAMVFAIIIALLSSLSSIALMATAGMFLTLMGIAGVSGTTVNLFIYSSSIRFFALSRTGLRYLERIISHQTTFKIIVKLRSFLFKKALNLELKEAQLLRNSEVTRLLTKNTETIELSFIRQVQPIFVALITVLLVNAYMAYFDVKFALINLILCICSGVLVPYLIYKVLLKNLKAQDTLLQNLNNLAFDLVNGLFDLKLTHAFDKFKEFPGKALNFVADGYSAYPLAKQQFELEENKEFNLTQVIGLTNEDPVSEEFRWVKQVVERLNRTFKSSYRVTCGYGSDEGALYGFSLWVAYYNFLRPHPYNYHRPLNELDALNIADNMPAKWQILISLGQQTILHMQESKTS